MQSLTFTFASTLSFCLFTAVAASAESSLTVMTYNTQHGGSSGHATLDEIALAISTQSPRPDVVVLQELESYTYLPSLVDRLDAYTGSTMWNGRYARHCLAMSSQGCAKPSTQSVVVLTTLPIVGSEARYFPYPDPYFAGGRAAVEADIQLPDRTVVHVWSTHLQPNGPDERDFGASRASSVRDLMAWTQTVAGPKLVGGDFNASPARPEISSTVSGMAHAFEDAWSAAGAGSGVTHGKSRIDYWFADDSRTASATAAWVGIDPGISDHRPLLATYAIASRPSAGVSPDTVAAAAVASNSAVSAAAAGDLFDDDFGAGVIDTTKWRSTFDGDMQDTTIPLTVTTALEIRPLADATGWRYNGIVSNPRLNLTNAFASVQLVQAPSASTAANAMFTVGSDSENFYRLFVSGGALFVERKIASIKTDFGPYPFTDGTFLRIGHDGRNVVFEAAVGADGASSPDWTLLYSEPWDPNVDVEALTVELKAGTSSPQPAPGTVIWDNVRVARTDPGAAPDIDHASGRYSSVRSSAFGVLDGSLR